MVETRSRPRKPAVAPEPGICLRKMLRFAARLGALAFFTWLPLTILQCMLWGSSLGALKKAVDERTAFLASLGEGWSQSLSYFSSYSVLDALGAGSLCAFFFFSLPQAMVLALFENFAREYENRIVRWSVRAVGQLAYWFFFQGLVLAYAGNIILLAWSALVAAGAPLLAGLVVERSRGFKEREHAVRNLCVTLACLVFVVLPLATSPIFDTVLHKERYAGVNALTLLRDWVLLGRDGQNAVNNWYYRFSPYAAENEAFTVFRPMLVGVCKVDLYHWKRVILRGFPQDRGTRGDRVQWLEFKDLQGGLGALRSGHIHMLLCDESLASTPVEPEGIPEGSLLFLGLRAPGRTTSGFPVAVQADFTALVEKNELGQDIPSTPLTRRYRSKHKDGLDGPQSAELHRYKGVAASWIGNPVSLAGILFLLIGGALVYTAMAVSSLGRWPWAAIGLAAVMSPWVIMGLWNNARVWGELDPRVKDKQTAELRLLQYHKAHEVLDRGVVAGILAHGLSSDSRLAMWEVNILGKFYGRLPAANQALIRSLLSGLEDSYPQRPLNFRYKYIEALAGIREMLPLLERLARAESHLYVRWYAESYGYGARSLDDYERDMLIENFWKG